MLHRPTPPVPAALLRVVLLAAAVDAAHAEAPPRHPKEAELLVFSDVFQVNGIIKSMVGPFTTRSIRVRPNAPPELLWLTGFQMEVVDAGGLQPQSYEFECHSNLAWPRDDPPGVQRPVGQVFTLTQGQVDVRLPPGFGLPSTSAEAIVFNSQVLNLTRPEEQKAVRHRARVRYVRDADLTQPMKPLVVTSAYVMASLGGEAMVYGVADPDPKRAAASCHAGALPRGAPGAQKDALGRPFTGHWVVEPGRHEYRTLVTDLMNIPYDTTVHFIGVHVHPYSQSLELRDLTTGKSVWKSTQTTHPDRPSLTNIDYYSGVEGLPIHAGHDYELVSVYDNPTSDATDAMATMFLYYLDQKFDKTVLAAAGANGADTAAP
jgi:hypothetical protein